MPVANRGQPPLVAHVIQRLAVGGLENGVVNLINCMPPERYRHAIICLTDFTEYAGRIHRQDVPIMELHQRSGRDVGVHVRFFRALRSLRPDIIHTRNLPALEFQTIAAVARVRGRVHGEHGRDMYDLDGRNVKYNLLRKTVRPLVHRYIAVSSDLAGWLVRTVRVQPKRVTQIYNGVDMFRFRPPDRRTSRMGPPGFVSPGNFVLGTVGRMEPVKDQLTLVRAFLHLLETAPGVEKHMRLVMVGDGQLRKEAEQILRRADAARLAWLPGERSDIPEIMRSLDLFVLPSIREGISNTILEAMASGLPVVATNVGGNPELVDAGETGTLVPPSDPIAMAEAIRGYFADRRKLMNHGRAGLKKVQTRFSMEAMVSGYTAVYDAVLGIESVERRKLVPEDPQYRPQRSLA